MSVRSTIFGSVLSSPLLEELEQALISSVLPKIVKAKIFL